MGCSLAGWYSVGGKDEKLYFIIHIFVHNFWLLDFGVDSSEVERKHSLAGWYLQQGGTLSGIRNNHSPSSSALPSASWMKDAPSPAGAFRTCDGQVVQTKSVPPPFQRWKQIWAGSPYQRRVVMLSQAYAMLPRCSCDSGLQCWSSLHAFHANAVPEAWHGWGAAGSPRNRTFSGLAFH